MLAGRRHPRRAQPADERAGENGGAQRIALEGAGADHRATLVIKIEHRGEADIQPDRQHFGRHQPAAVFGQCFCIRLGGQRTHRRQAYEALAQALHATALLVDGED